LFVSIRRGDGMKEKSVIFSLTFSFYSSQDRIVRIIFICPSF